jgi:hypothetical protein
MVPIGMPSNIPSIKTFETKKVLLDFLNLAKNVKTFEDKCTAYPNLVLFHDGFLFCSVHIFLQKPQDWKLPDSAKNRVREFLPEVTRDNSAAIKALRNDMGKANSSIKKPMLRRLISLFK